MPKPMASAVVGIGPAWLDRRRAGLKNPLGTRCHVYEQMYSNILPCGCWDHTFNNTYTSVHGGVFSLEFSPEGSLLVAACEKRSVLMFDPLTHKRIHTVENAHLDCVNCVRFLDSRAFATCSDDYTVALWDARNLSQKVRSLKGHSNWVKNIEYSARDDLLVTSGFDGSILTWEMNKYREDGTAYNKVFSTNGLMRTRLTPDATKMVICTTGGYLIVIHNLDLNTLSQDLDGFKIFQKMMMQKWLHLSRYILMDILPLVGMSVITKSLSPLPAPRSNSKRDDSPTSFDASFQWSCIHNIEERLSSDESDCTDDEAEDSESCKPAGWSGAAASISTTPSYIIQHTVVQNERRTSAAGGEAGTSSEHRDLSVSPSDVWEAVVAIQEARIRRETDGLASEMTVGHMFRRHAMDAGARVRPPNSESQIFVTRIFPSANSARESAERPRGFASSSPPAFRRNASANAGEATPADSARRHRPRFGPSSRRKKLPIRQRYASLYRRSLVGRYDRTSVLKKPIYNCGTNQFKLKKLRESFKLNTNYEMNETRRLQNELRDRPHADEASGSGTRVQERGRPVINERHRSGKPSRSAAAAAAAEGTAEVQGASTSVDAALGSLTQDLNSFESNLNSFRESITSLEGTINSTCNALRRGQSILQTINDLIGDEDLRTGSEEETSPGGESASSPEGTSGRPAPTDRPARPDGEETDAGPRVRGGAPENGRRSSASALRPDAQLRPNGERTILMGVFRAGNEDGVRGTSMRRHNIAAVTVSSPPQRTTDSATRRPRAGRTRTGCGDDDVAATTAAAADDDDDDDDDDADDARANGSGKRHPAVPVNKKIHQNTKRLTHYVEEPNLGRGFIKELCISPDGRIICSPFGNGIRLLSFSPTVQDIFHCYPRSPPIPLHELTLNIAHTDIVVSTKFSPFHNLLVSGCLSGKIVYYQPFL